MTTPAAMQAGANGLSDDANAPAVETDKLLFVCLILLPRGLGCLSACRQTQINSVPHRINRKTTFAVPPDHALARAITVSGCTARAPVAESPFVLPPVLRERSHALQNQSATLRIARQCSSGC